MRINNNITALNAWRNLNNTERRMGKTMEKLSSGLRINRAADDAAGLAISERMKSQVSGLDRAVANAQDGISLIQTAEGALDETHTILNRVRELTIQAANQTNEIGDIEKLQLEVDELINEIDRIAQTTEFNTKPLLDGSLTEIELQIGANPGQSIRIDFSSMDALGLGLAEEIEVEGEGVRENSISFLEKEVNGDGGNVDFEKTIDDIQYLAMVENAEEHPHFEEILTQGNIVEQSFIRDGEYYPEGSEIPEGGMNLSYGEVVYLENTEIDYEPGDTATGTYYNSEGELVIEEGQTFPSSENSPKGVITNTEFGSLIKLLDDAIDGVSEFRSQLGAAQNRLEHTINNLEVAKENLSAAESRIRDADIALEMMELTRHQIMQQAGTTMLAQANMKPQAILQLLG